MSKEEEQEQDEEDGEEEEDASRLRLGADEAFGSASRAREQMCSNVQVARSLDRTFRL